MTDMTETNKLKVTERQKRTVVCPQCLAPRGQGCESLRIRKVDPTIGRAHNERRDAYVAYVAHVAAYRALAAIAAYRALADAHGPHADAERTLAAAERTLAALPEVTWNWVAAAAAVADIAATINRLRRMAAAQVLELTRKLGTP